MVLGKRSPRRTPWSYRPGNTALHRAPSLFKFIILLLLNIPLFFGIPALSLVTLVLILLSLIAALNPLSLLRGFFPLFCMLLFTAALAFISAPADGRIDALLKSACFSWGIALSFASGALFFSVTSISSLCRMTGRKNPFALSLSLMLMFIPRFFEVWENTNLACEARCCKKGVRRLALVVPLVLESMITIAYRASGAIETRMP